MACNSEGMKMQQLENERIKEVMGQIKHKLLVMSGKGGVGKSTVAANIAIALSKKGHKVGLLDVDVHGPSIAGLLGIKSVAIKMKDNLIEPYEYNSNLKVISMQGFLEEQDTPVIWRGPAKAGIIRRFLYDVDWGNLDYLVIDSPPGTGDEPLTIIQAIENCKAVVVTTPQEIALADVRKSLNFAQRLNMQVVGIVENMSGFVCPSCGDLHNIFKSGGGERIAQERQLPFLGKLPIDPMIVEAGDIGAAFDNLQGHTKEAVCIVVDNIAAQLNSI